MEEEEGATGGRTWGLAVKDGVVDEHEGWRRGGRREDFAVVRTLGGGMGAVCNLVAVEIR